MLRHDEEASMVMRRHHATAPPIGVTGRSPPLGLSQSNFALGSISEERRVAAETLSALGYPVEWCIRALEAAGGDLNDAAEYILSHSARLEEESARD